MPSQEFNQASDLLHELESRWISLLRWMGEQKGIAAEEIVLALGDAGFDFIRNYERRKEQAPTATFTPLHFLQFPNYVELARVYAAELDSLGQPPRGWTGRLNTQNQKAVTYRNDLQHAVRFDELPVRDRREAVEIFRQQLDDVRAWWPNHPYRHEEPITDDLDPARDALRALSRDEKSTRALTEELAFDAIRNPVNLLPTGGNSPLQVAVGADIGRLFRVGQKNVGGAQVGLYIAYLNKWPKRSVEREKYRRRLAKALVTHQSQVNSRFLVILADDSGEYHEQREIEIIYPREQAGRLRNTVRAAVNLDRPTRYHVELIRELRIAGLTSLKDVTNRWNTAFNVERVTKRFYQEFAALRDQLARAFIATNPDNPVVRGFTVADFAIDPDKATILQREFKLNITAFATRQVSRILFAWFLQQKGWLGAETIPGSRTLFVDLFRKRPKPGDTYFADVLVPLFFDGLGERENDPRHMTAQESLGEMLNATVSVPYIDGGLFRDDVDEFEATAFGVDEDGNRTIRIELPDSLFDPARDNPDVVRGAQRQRTVLGLLRSYRFTTQESTPDDQSVDPDPELLGKVFENLYQAKDRHDSGTYYTPREIVRYMCRQALDGYLTDTAGLDQATIDWLREEAVDFTATNRRLTAAQQRSLDDALDELKVIDPAVGSGAFLIGMLQEILLLRRGAKAAATDHEVDRGSRDVYEWKLRAITQTLHGVDIHPTAVEICRLRLWLSLLIEYDVEYLSDIPALPNLEFRVVAGDSLIDRMGESSFRESLPYGYVQADFEVVRQYDHLADLRRRFDEDDRAARVGRVHQLASQIRQLYFDVCRTQLDAEIVQANHQLNQAMTAVRPSQPKIRRATARRDALVALQNGLHSNAPFLKPLLWPLIFPHVFNVERHGFDIVVANPPYIRQESLDPIDQETYKAAFPGVQGGTADIYVYFFERAVQLLRNGGWLAFITSNKYMRAEYGAGLREFLPTTVQLQEVLDFGDVAVFDVAAYPAVVVGQKVATPDQEATVEVADLVVALRTRLRDAGFSANNVEHVREQLLELPELVAAEHVREFPQVLLKRDGWILEDPALVRLFERLMNEGTPLREYVNGRIYYGIKTGFNKAFVIDQAKRDELVAADPRSAEIIKPWLRGRDIKRWRAEWAGLFVIFTKRGSKISDYPAIEAHLEQWRTELTPKSPGASRSGEGRKPGDYMWYEIQDTVAYYPEFEEPKVILTHFLNWSTFAYDPNGLLHNNAATFFVTPRPAIAALLNSDLGWFVLSNMGSALQNGYTQLFVQFFERFPIPHLDSEDHWAELDHLVENGALTGLTDEERVLEVVNQLYALGDHECESLQQWVVNRRSLLNSDD